MSRRANSKKTRDAAACAQMPGTAERGDAHADKGTALADALTPEQQHHMKMTQTPIPRLVCTLAVPTIISMLVTSLYSMADTFFVAKLGTSATGAVGVVFSLMAVIQAVGFMLGMGAGNNAARLLGAKRYDEATENASSAFFAALLFGVVLCAFGTVFTLPMVRLLGATETIAPYAADYAHYILYAAPILCASFVMNNILRGEGKAMFAMVGLTVGGVLNIALDPLFIFVFDCGIAGAAIATALSQLVSFLLLLSCFLLGKSGVRLRLSRVSHRFSIYAGIVRTGFPSFCRQGLASVATMLLNVQAAVYGDAAVAAMSIVGRFFMLLFSVMLGFGQGFQPVAGFNYGAKKYDRVRSATLFTAQTGTLLMLVAAALGFFFAPQIITQFRRDDAAVIAIGTFAFRAQCLVLPLSGLSTTAGMTLQCTGHSGPATLLSLCRQGIFFMPLIVLLPFFFGLAGVQLTQAFSDGCTFLVSVPFFFNFLKQLKQKQLCEDAAQANKA
ncbi:MAG: MATE family efflux transporter [Ruthenibacterium sp.]